MATFLDLSTVLSPFADIFVFIFAYVLLLAMLMFTGAGNMFGGNKVIVYFVPAVFAVFIAMSDTATEVIKTVAPIFVVVLIFVLIISVVGRSITGGALGGESFNSMRWIVFVILVISLVVGTLGAIREKVEVPETGEEDFEETRTVIFHPNFIGLILFFLVAVFTVALLSAKSM